ncbi:MAG: hypothetical protein LLG05_08475 [Porphyromonadaceae bacterium]|nr:hypothetical protein [Porphyromonadaceae bacterium]
MIILIITLLGVIIGLLLRKRRGHETTLDWLSCFIMSALLLGFIVNMIAGASMSETLPRRVVSTKYIYSLQDNSLTKGVFFLGGGSINERPVYSYYEKGNYGYRLGCTYADEVEIVESNSTPRIEKTKPYLLDKKPFYLSMIWFMPTAGMMRTTIYVPVGTIIRNFNLDSQY